MTLRYHCLPISNDPFVTVMFPVACPCSGVSTALNVPLIRVDVNDVIVTEPLLPAAEEVWLEMTCDPLKTPTPSDRNGMVFERANVPVPATWTRLSDTLRVLLPAAIVSVPPFSTW